MIAIVDYGVGNLFSVKCSFDAIGAETVITSDADVIHAADRILLPGVGAFENAARKLRESGLDKVIKDEVKSGKPLLGICLGMQLLFDRSFEFGEHEGLGLIPGEIRPIADVVPKGLKIPHIGWNSLSVKDKANPLYKYVKDGDCVYFVHSYYAKTDNKYILAETDYGAPITASAACGNVYGCQFHPEKSGNVGLNILRAFCEV
ncbi:MAG: imidazole glycerol phosphate synthase subunit HisH [Clostridia bacterium]|nr:imidazole glycerol phosphate synthase subunit HisH [Clostridia bacterium]